MLNNSYPMLTKGLRGLALLVGCSVALQASPPTLSAPAVPAAPQRASANVGTTTGARVSPSVPMPPRLVLQLPRFPKLPELQPVLPVFADPDSDGAMPPRLALQLPRFPKLQPELQPVLPVLAAPDSHAP
jgi:hypothetical protein